MTKECNIPSNQRLQRWKCVGYCRHCTANEDDSTFSKEWGHFEKSDEGVWARADSALAEIERLRAALVRARPCVKESLTHWDQLLLAQEKAPRSNAPHMFPDHYIGTLRKQVEDLSVLLVEIDEAAPPAETKPVTTSGE